MLNQAVASPVSSGAERNAIPVLPTLPVTLPPAIGSAIWRV